MISMIDKNYQCDYIKKNMTSGSRMSWLTFMGSNRSQSTSFQSPSLSTLGHGAILLAGILNIMFTLSSKYNHRSNRPPLGLGATLLTGIIVTYVFIVIEKLYVTNPPVCLEILLTTSLTSIYIVLRNIFLFQCPVEIMFQV